MALDMNIDLKNLNMSDLKDKILKLADKKTLIKIGIISGAIIFFLIIYYAILSPMVETRKVKLDDMNLKKEETIQFTNDVSSMKKKIKKLKPEYEKYSSLFHSKAEVEGLYQTLSIFAGQNDLVISKIEKKDPIPVFKPGVTKQTKENTKIEMLSHYKIPVDFEITGNFLGYIKFKRQLSLSQKTLNFDKESIKVVKGVDSTGAIKVNGTLTIVGLVDEFF